MRHKKILLCVVLASLLSLSTSLAAVTPDAFARSRAIEFEPIEKDSLIVVTFADDMYQALNPTFSDLRVFDGESPTACEVTPGPVSEKAYLLPSKAVEIEQDEEKWETRITIDVAKRPVTKIEIKTPNRNFRREVEVFIPNLESRGGLWEKMHSAQIDRIDLEGAAQEHLEINLPQQRVSYLQLRIINGESRPIEIEKVELFGPTYECRFVAEPKRSYTLEYGSTSIEAGKLDTAALDAALGRKLKPVVATLSNKVLERRAIDASPKPDRMLNAIFSNPKFIFPAVVALVILLAWALFHAARRLPTEEEV